MVEYGKDIAPTAVLSGRGANSERGWNIPEGQHYTYARSRKFERLNSVAHYTPHRTGGSASAIGVLNSVGHYITGKSHG
jgi:hypothetical protein